MELFPFYLQRSKILYKTLSFLYIKVGLSEQSYSQGRHRLVKLLIEVYVSPSLGKKLSSTAITGPKGKPPLMQKQNIS
ncbi:hypothetical protein C7B76_16230 [filamentous cyanobacterium CCP2]|nr:hypothetical protein C7B76_16230 [filamentous cyanobacterium CCP2]